MKKILCLIASVFLLHNIAAADTCGKSLTGVFTSFQATKLCSVFGSAVNHSLIPSADNTYDVGSSSFGWRTGYFDTSIITPLLQSAAGMQIKVDGDAQRLFTFDASSDTALTTTFGDGGTTALQTLFVGAATADADDDSTVTVGGGGAGSAGRGAFAKFQGAEATGDITLSASSTNSSGVRMLAPAASGAFYDFSAAGNSILGFNAGGDITLDATNGGNIISAKALNGTKGVILGAASVSSDVAAYAAPLHTYTTTGQIQMTNLIYGNTASDQWVTFLKSRSATADGNTIVQSGDGVAHLVGYGANGTTFDPSMAIDFVIDGTPGASADMPGAIIFKTSPDGSATLAQVLKLGNDKAATFSGALTSTATGALGWTPVAGANTACNTTCTSACVYGIDSAAPQTWLACTDATADMCLCAGAS